MHQVLTPSACVAELRNEASIQQESEEDEGLGGAVTNVLAGQTNTVLTVFSAGVPFVRLLADEKVLRLLEPTGEDPEPLEPGGEEPEMLEFGEADLELLDSGREDVAYWTGNKFDRFRLGFGRVVVQSIDTRKVRCCDAL